jgi:hypothetical protein
MAKDIGGGCLLDDSSGVHDGDGFSQLSEQGEIVGDEQDRESELLAQAFDLGQDLPLGHDVEGGCRLVQDHDLRLEGQRHGDHDPLPHSARELMGVAAEAVRADADHGEQLGGPRPASPPVEPTAVGDEGIRQLGLDIDDGVEGVHRGLEHNGDLGPAEAVQLFWSGFEDRDRSQPAPLGRPGVMESDAATTNHSRRAKQARHGIDQGRLAASALARQPEHFTAVQGEVDAAYCPHGVIVLSVVDAEVANFEQDWSFLGLALREPVVVTKGSHGILLRARGFRRPVGPES